MSSSQEVYFLVNVDGESRWTKIGGFGKIWIQLFWKIYTDGKYEGGADPRGDDYAIGF